MTVVFVEITEDFAVGSQLAPEDLAELARLGFRSVINNRPDGEGGPDQPSDAELRAAADAHGIFYAHLPVPNLQFDERAVIRMRALIGELPKPMLAFCRTGTRAAGLYRAAHPELQV
jgi:uncharacterized protein (TIGR01244 family)